MYIIVWQNGAHSFCGLRTFLLKALIYPLFPKSAQNQNPRKISNSILLNIEKQMVPCKSTAEEASFKWSHRRILLTDSKETCLHNWLSE